MNTAWRRSHPVALVAALIDSVKDTVALILAMLAIALPNRDAPIVLTIIGVVIALLVACMLVFPVLRWLTTSYRLDENGVTQRSGMLNRKRTTISYDHIHAISSSSPIYMRPFRVVTLDITAAGGESGITLRGVPSSVQLELEAARQASGTPAGPAPAVAAGTREMGGQGWCAGPVPAAAAEDEVRVPDGKRIVAAGATMLTLFTVFTRRSRIQSVERSTTPWRQRRGVESRTLPLFVSNGINTLRFTALRSADAATLAAWAEHGLVRADTSPGRRVDAAAGGMVDNGYVQDDEWRT